MVKHENLRAKAKLIYFLGTCLLCSIYASAQRDAPVIGNAAQLVDLLRKDYHSVDEGNREAEIMKDRVTVISLFKAYLTEDQISNISNGAANAAFALAQGSIKNTWDSIAIYKKKIAVLASASVGDSSNAEKLAAGIVAASLKETQYTHSYYTLKQLADGLELQMLIGQYQGENEFLRYVTALFLKKYTCLQTGLADPFAVANSNTTIQKSLPFIGGDLNFTMAIDGLAKFIAKRLKEELTTYVIERVKTWLQNPSEDDPLAELKVLLPATTSYLAGFSADRVTNFTNEIKQYIEDDFAHLQEHLPALRNTPRIQRLIANHPNLDFAMEALEIVPALSRLKTPADYFSLLINSRNLARWQQDLSHPASFNVANGIYLTTLVARSLMFIENGERRFATPDYLSGYVGDIHFFLLYTGFLYQQTCKYDNIRFVLPGPWNVPYEVKGQLKPLVNLDPTLAQTIAIVRPLTEAMLTRIVKQAEKVYNMAADIKKATQNEKKISADTIYNYAAAVINLAEDAVAGADTLLNMLSSSLGAAPADAAFHIRSTTTPYFTIARISNEIFNDLANKKYATALIKGAELSGSLVNNNHFSKLTAVAQQISHLQVNEVTASWARVIDTIVKANANGHPVVVAGELATDFYTVAGEINKLYLYLQINASNAALAGNIDQVKQLFLAGIPQATIPHNTMNMPAIAAFFTGDDDFKKVVISYYTGVFITRFTSDLSAEMNLIKMNDVAGTEVNVFSAADVTKITEALSNYILALYENYFRYGNKKPGHNLLHAQDALMATAKAYLGLLPEKLNITSDSRLMSLIHFVNDMAAAQNSDDVAKAIEAFALPAGSYAIKRSSRFNFSLNSYPGILPAWELSWQEGNTRSAFTAGFTAPVGLGLSWGTRNKHANGLFIPIIDIGAFTRFRLSSANDHVKTMPDITFRNVFSPGIYYTHGFNRCPLALNIGFQYGPQVQEVLTDQSTGTLSTRSYDAIRIGVGLVFDIPLLNLHTQPR